MTKNMWHVQVTQDSEIEDDNMGRTWSSDGGEEVQEKDE